MLFAQQTFIELVIDKTTACIEASVIHDYLDHIFVTFDFHLDISFIVTEAELSCILVADSISPIDWFVAPFQFLVVEALEKAEILLLLNLLTIIVVCEGRHELVNEL